jgi:DNA-binding MurR/RpiR family transcriptional regulator
MTFLERVGREYSHLTKSQQRIAEFMAGSYLDAAFLSSTELATKLEVDPGTVTRFAQRLGYDGYPDLIGDVQKLVKRELRDIWEPPIGEPTAADLFRQGIDNARRNLEEIIICNPGEKVEQIINILESAKRIFILSPTALGYHQGSLLRYSLLAADFPVHDVCGDILSMALRLRDARKGDVFIGLGSTKHAADVAAVLRQVKMKGAKTVGLVGTMTCPTAEACEVNLVCPARSLVTFPSFLALTGAIFALFEVLVLRRKAEIEQVLQELERSCEAAVEGRGWA